jgi:hypothetical protein
MHRGDWPAGSAQPIGAILANASGPGDRSPCLCD